ncbi:hypothetical protein A7D00_0354 [Trichophyton violaceum]|uniref:Uncharacterized protein n=1 Tax=Trichophyton violaceum TaxID=34388 RepID=A0A178FQI6_TRIVO|nr:hypothetical protein A7D00_0354 [Trichophyton violaceum]
MCYRKYYKYKCCALEKDVDWVACEDRPPGMNCPKAQEHNWQGPYARYLGEIEGPCWNCMWASYNDGGKAKREFIENFGKRKPGEQPWESDEERKDQRMAGEDWYWIMRRRQKKQREKERRKLEAEAGRVTHSTVQWPEGVEGEGTSGSSTPGTSGSRPDSLPESQHASRPSSRYAFSVAGAQTPSRQLPN